MKMFSVYDKQACAFMPPFQARAVGQAVRSFMDAVNSKDHEFARHPGDYELYHVGEFDEIAGCYDMDPNAKYPKRVLTGLDVLGKAETVPG